VVANTATTALREHYAALFQNYCIKGTNFEAGSAGDAFVRYDVVRILLSTLNRIGGTFLSAQCTPGTFICVDGIRQQIFADTGWAMFVVNVGLVLIAKMANGRQHRIRSRLPQPAQRSTLDSLANSLQLFDIIWVGAALANSINNVQHPRYTDAAWNAFSARFLLHKFQEEPRHVNHAGIGIHYHKSARSHDRTKLVQRLIVYRDIEIFLRNTTTGRPANLGSLEFFSARNSTTDIVNNFSKRCSDRYFNQPGNVNCTGKCKNLRPMTITDPEGRKPFASVDKNRRNIRKSFDVVQ